MKRFVIFALVLVGGAILILFLSATRKARPSKLVYGGRSLDSWVLEYEVGLGTGNRARADAASEALRKMGTNATPSLIGKLERPERPVERLALTIWREPVLSAWGFEPTRARQRRAMTALGLLGNDAVAAVPVLIPFCTNSDPGLRGSAVVALGNIGPPASAALPVLVECLTNAPSSVLRENAVMALAGIQRQECVPLMWSVLTNEDVRLRYWATHYLQQYARQEFEARMQGPKPDPEEAIGAAAPDSKRTRLTPTVASPP